MHTLYSSLKCGICVAIVMRQQHILNRDSRVTLHVLSSCMMYWQTASSQMPKWNLIPNNYIFYSEIRTNSGSGI